MWEIPTVGLDRARNVFRVRGADASGRAVLRGKLRRAQVLGFFGQPGPCTVAMEACGGARFWGREIGQAGPRGAADPAGLRPAPDLIRGEALRSAPDERCRRCRGASREAAQRPNMRFVSVKSRETQGAASAFRVRERLIRQRTRTIDALRGHLLEFGEVVPQGAWNARHRAALIEAPESDRPDAARAALQVRGEGLRHLEKRIATLDAETARRAREDETARRAREDETARRLMAVPGIGPLIATAPATLAPPPETFRRAVAIASRTDGATMATFAAWLGLTPRQHSMGGKQRLGATTKMGGRSLRRLLILGADSVVIKRHAHVAATPGTWLGGMLARVALANRMARIVWAFAIGLERMATDGSLARGGVHKAPAAAAWADRRSRGRRTRKRARSGLAQRS